MLRLRSARDLRLETHWRFGFVRYGARAAPTHGVVFVDIGSNSEPLPGVLDHHQEEPGFPCSAAIVASRADLVYNHLLEPWLRRADAGQLPAGTRWEPQLVTHVYPDWDSAATAVLIEHLIEYGELPPRASDLIRYTGDIDQGRWRLDSTLRHAPHLAMLIAAHIYKDDHRNVLATGMELVRTYLDTTDPLAWTRMPVFTNLFEELQRQFELYERDKAAADMLDELRVPLAGGNGHLRVPAFLLREYSQCALNKYLVRADGYPLFLCPYTDPRHDKSVVIISVDPNFKRDGIGLTLQGLGYALEREEIAARKRLHGGHDDRPGPPRWNDGACTNADPWYDGRGHQFTLVQAPDCGTELPVSRIREILIAGEYADTPITGARITLIWKDPEIYHGRPTGDPLALSIEGARFRLVGLDPPPGTEAAELVRADLDQELSTGLLAVVLRTGEAPTFESLIEAVRNLQVRIGQPASYLVARVAPQAGTSYDRAIHLLRQLGHGQLRSFDSGPRNDAAFYNSRQILRLVNSNELFAQGEYHALLYAAFLRETLSATSWQIAAKGLTHASKLREGFLKFQALYYRRDIHADAISEETFDAIAGAMELPAVYDEVNNQLARLAELQQETAQRHFEVLGLLIGVAGVLQTIATYFGLTRPPSGWTVLAVLSVAAASILLLVFAWRVRRWISTPLFAMALGVVLLGSLASLLFW